MLRISHLSIIHLHHLCTSTSIRETQHLRRSALIALLEGSRHFSATTGESSGSKWMPDWLKTRLPGFAGGTKEFGQVPDLTVDTYLDNISRARKIGSLAGYVHGTRKIADPVVQGTLRMQEDIIRAMTTEEKSSVASLRANEREDIASRVGCTPQQVDDCIAKYLWTKQMVDRLQALKKAGKPMPKTIDEVEQQLGTWQDFKQSGGGAEAFDVVAPPGSILVAADAREPKTQKACPLAKRHVSRNTKCPLTDRRYKQCCGRI